MTIEPTREKLFIKNDLGHIDFKYVEDMLYYYAITGKQIDLTKFSSAEVNTNPDLYKEYTKRFLNNF